MKSCKNCDFFKLIYRIHVYRPLYSLSFPHYYCAARGELTERENVCGNWRKKNRGYDISPQRFIEVEEDIKKLIDLTEQ